MLFREKFKEKCSNSEYYFGINKEEMLFEYHWLKEFSNLKRNKLKHVIKIFLGILNGILLQCKLMYSKNKRKFKNKIFFILTFSDKNEPQNKINKILENLLLEFDKNEIVLVVFNKYIYNKYKFLEYNVLWINIPKYFIKLKNIQLEDLFIKNSGKLFKYSRCLEIIKKIYYPLIEMKPKAIITTQDYLFTSLARQQNIPTFSHLHGIVLKNYEDCAGFIYYYSDNIMLWGKRDIDILKEYLLNKKLFAVGTNKFNSLLENRKLEKKYVTFCMTNLSNELEKELFFIKEFGKLNINLEKILKVHPGMDKKIFENKYSKYIKNFKVETDYKYIEKAKYLLTYQTTAIVDALCCGASVIEIIYDSKLDKNEDFLNDLEESILSFDNLEVEIQRREKNKEYFKQIMLKQEKALKKIIYSFDSSKLEKKIIDQILEKNYANFKEEQESVK